MSLHIPDDEINTAIVEHQLPVSPTLLRCLLRQLAAAIPFPKDTPDHIAAETHEAARELFFAKQPHDADEASAAIRAVTAHFAAMDLHARASKPGLTDDTVMRLRARADSCARAAGANRRPAPRKQPDPTPQRDPIQLPEPRRRFQPRDRFGEPIPLHLWELMTGAQRRATYAPDLTPELEAAALADEAAMIAEQQAKDAAATRPTNGEARQP